MESTKEGLKREIGVWGLSANLINIIVGAGIFVLPAIVAAGLGTASIIAYLFCGVLIALIMLCFAEVGSKITATGGAYTYIEVAFGKYAGFLTAIIFVTSCITADAAVSNALADILSTVFPLFKEQWFRIVVFVIIFTGLAFTNIIGVKRGIGLVKFTTIAKLAPLILLIILGFSYTSVSNLSWTSTPAISDIGKMSLILFFAFQGGEGGLAVNGEVKNPQKTIPRAIFIGILVVLVLYILIQTVAQGVLGASLPSFKEAPLAEVAKHIIGPVGFTIMTVGAAISMFGNVSGEILSIPRVLYGAARDEVIPSTLLSKVHKKYATPYISIIIYAGIGLVLASVGGFKQLAILSGTSVLLIYLGVALSCIKLRKKKDSHTQTFRIPGGYVVPIASILVILWFLSNLTFNEKIVVVVFIAFLTLIYFLMTYLRNKKKNTF